MPLQINIQEISGLMSDDNVQTSIFESSSPIKGLSMFATLLSLVKAFPSKLTLGLSSIRHNLPF